MPVYLNNELVWKRYFPCGELYVQIPNDKIKYHNEVKVIYRDSDDLILAALIGDAVRDKSERLVLNIPYFPYSRQDRACAPGEPFSLNRVGGIISCIKWDEIRTYDIHNPRAIEMYNLKNLKLSCPNVVKEFAARKELVVLSPDKGAAERAKGIADELNVPFYCADKKREDGKVTIVLPYFSDLTDKEILIVDDILDGGATFISLAKELNSIFLRAKSLNLLISHAFFSEGSDKLLELYDNIFIINDYRNIKEKGIHLCRL